MVSLVWLRPNMWSRRTLALLFDSGRSRGPISPFLILWRWANFPNHDFQTFLHQKSIEWKKRIFLLTKHFFLLLSVIADDDDAARLLSKKRA